MTSYPRTEGAREWEKILDPRPWLYQTPEQILIKASNGASDFGNKFGAADLRFGPDIRTRREQEEICLRQSDHVGRRCRLC